MCRLLAIKSKEPVQLQKYLVDFSLVCRTSKEFQGHGWGISYLENGELKHYKNIKPIWDDDLTQFPDSTLFIVHARSAFKDEGIVIENNMPFHDEDVSFIFNGELRGVKLSVPGRIGAEKIFNYVQRFDDELLLSLNKATKIISDRTNYVRAMNIIMTDGTNLYLHTEFGEDPDYFTMHKHVDNDMIILCSEPFFQDDDWEPIDNGTTEVMIC